MTFQVGDQTRVDISLTNPIRSGESRGLRAVSGRRCEARNVHALGAVTKNLNPLKSRRLAFVSRDGWSIGALAAGMQ